MKLGSHIIINYNNYTIILGSHYIITVTMPNKCI